MIKKWVFYEEEAMDNSPEILYHNNSDAILLINIVTFYNTKSPASLDLYKQYTTLMNYNK